MLQKLLVRAQCLKYGAVFGYGGSELHGWFFKWIQEIDPMLSQILHELEDKPFVIGPLRGGRKEQGMTLLAEGEEYSFTIAALNEGMYGLLNIMLEQLSGKIIMLGSASLQVKEIIPLLGQQGLQYTQILEEVRPANGFTLEFCSPTSFRKKGSQIIFPSPELVLQSLWRKWNAFSRITLPEIFDYSSIQVSRYKLETQLVHFRKYMIIGFVGYCGYQIDKTIPIHVKTMFQALGFFAGLAGVGYKTSMSLGDTRYYQERGR